MANNIIRRTWKQGGMVNIEDLRGSAFQAENGGHTFLISGVDENGNALALSGTPAGVLLRADGQDVTLTCSVSDGVVSATLPANAYVVPGRVGITVFLTSGGQKTAIYAAVGSVATTSSGIVAPPAGSDVVDLVNAIATAVATIPASYTDLMAAVAPTYSTSALYAVGSYAWYSGKLYRCTTAITSGETWTSAHWTLANLGSDVSDLKSALSEVSYNLWDGYVSYTFVRYITITGLNIPAGTYTLSALVTSTDTDTPDVCRILFKSGSTSVDYFYLNRNTRSSRKITLNANCNTVLLYAAETSNDAAGDTATWKDIMLVSGDIDLPYRPHSIAVDYKLRQEIEAEKAIVDVDDFGGSLANTANWEAGTISDSTGEDESQANSIRTKKMIRTTGVNKIFVRVFYETPDSTVDVSTTDNYDYRFMYLYQYRDNGTFISRISTSKYTKVYTLDSECGYVRMAIWTRRSNSTIATIMPSTIDFYSADGEYFLPKYYDTYLSQKATVIEEYARAAGGDGAVFAFITDQHSPEYNQDWSPAILHRLSELVHIPIVFNGGDLSHTGQNPEHYADLQRKNYNGEIHHAVGNHDFLALTLGKSLYYDMDIYNSNQVGSVDHHYYYVDNEQLKIRFIVLAAYMESKKALDPSETSTKAQGGYTSEQISWINNVALDIPEGWKAIVFTHYFYMLNYDEEADPPYPATLSYGTVILRSINANGNVICVVQGHTHDDRIIKQHGTGEEATWAVPIIMTTSDKNRVYMNDDTPEEHWIVNRSTGTVYEQAFDVIIVNQNTRKINVVRIGGMADSGVNDNRGTAVEVREVTY